MVAGGRVRSVEDMTTATARESTDASSTMTSGVDLSVVFNWASGEFGGGQAPAHPIAAIAAIDRSNP